MNSLNEALKQFEATEANLAKLERLWGEIKSMIPDGIAFGDTNDGVYDDRCRAFSDVREGLPTIDGWELPECLYELNQIAQMRFDANELGEIENLIYVEELLVEQEKHLKDYRYRLNKKRRQLVRGKIIEIVDRLDSIIQKLSSMYPDDYERTSASITVPIWDSFKQEIATIDMLLGSTVRPQRWSDLQRHIRFGQVGDLWNIRDHDWPAIKSGIMNTLYGESDPIPVEAKDLGALVESKPQGDVVTRLKWESLGDSDFERLLFCLISQSTGYENPEWLTNTNAPDRGRDLSVMRVFEDSLAGTSRRRVIIQCKHWLSKSISLQDVTSTREQMKLWEPPRVDVLVIATSGRFTTDAIQSVEKHNQSDTGLRIEMWAESHLEKLLASRPALIGEFKLR